MLHVLLACGRLDGSGCVKEALLYDLETGVLFDLSSAHRAKKPVPKQNFSRAVDQRKVQIMNHGYSSLLGRQLDCSWPIRMRRTKE